MKRSGDMVIEDLREEYEERAAILQYDAGLSRLLAEARAVHMIVDRFPAEERKAIVDKLRSYI